MYRQLVASFEQMIVAHPADESPAIRRRSDEAKARLEHWSAVTSNNRLPTEHL